MNTPGSLTGDYLSGRRKIPVPEQRRKGNGKYLKVLGAAENNLRHIDVSFPLGTFTCGHRRVGQRKVLPGQRDPL